MATKHAEAFDVGPEVAPPAAIENIVKLGTEMQDVQQRIKEITELLSRTKEYEWTLRTVTIPDALSELGMEGFILPDGTELRLEDVAEGTLPIKDQAKRAEALQEVIRLGAESIIKTEVRVAFARSQHNEALDLVGRLRDEGLEAELKSDIHPSSYVAWVKEMLRNGDQFDPDKLSVRVGKGAKLIPVKEKKPVVVRKTAERPRAPGKARRGK